MRLKTLFIVPIAVISLMAAGTTAVSASTDRPVTNAVAAAAQAPVNLGSAGSFAILSKAGVTDVPASAIKGDVLSLIHI